MRARGPAGVLLFLPLLAPVKAFAFSMLRPAATSSSSSSRSVGAGGGGGPTKRPRLSSSSAAASSSSSDAGGRSKGGLPEIYKTEGKRERPLRVLFVGHNPSDAAWKAGHYYANPSNRFWHLLRESRMIPASFTCENDGDLPHLCGIGFTDLGSGIPGTKSSAFAATLLHSWRASLYERLQAHAERSGAPPKIVAFTGKRQFQELLFDYGSKPTVTCGLQIVRPPGFPFRPEQTKLFVLTSPSGASALTNEARLAPYLQLAQELEAIPWVPEED